MIELAIVEDNLTYRKSLINIIELAKDMHCIGSYTAVEPCLKQLQSGEMAPPDIVLLDLNLSGENGIKMLPLLKKAAPDTDVIILTQNSNFRVVLEALHLGASGYLLKSASVKDIRNVIRDVAEGGTHIDSKLSRVVLAALCGKDTPTSNPLSDRETEILQLLSQGFVKKEVADKIGVSYHTIAFHVRNIFDKLDTPNLTSAVAKAARQGLI